MKNLAVITVLCFVSIANATIYIDDQPNYSGYYAMEDGQQFTRVMVLGDGDTFIMNGGVIEEYIYCLMGVYAEMNNGEVGTIRVEDSGTSFVVNDGRTWRLQANYNASITMYGGTVTGNIVSSNGSRQYLHGGDVSGEIYSHGSVNLYGDFYVNGIHVTEDKSIIDLSGLGQDPYNHNPAYTGSITGTFENGGSLSVSYYIPVDSGNINVSYVPVPEPTTLLLLGLGGLLIRRKR